MAYRNDDDRSFDLSGHPKSAVLNRSLTVHHHKSSPPLSPTEFTKKPPLERSASLRGKVKKLCSIFEKPPPTCPPPAASPKPSKAVSSDCGGLASSTLRLPGTEDRVVIYFTSLRGIRRTYTDCYAVRMIFKGFRVNLDERDISMDSAYKKELQSIVGEKTVTLPQVFIKGRHIGGVEIVRQLNEAGELRKMLTGLPIRASKPGMGYICEGCGDARFIPCSNCSGSRKVFDDNEGQPKRCLECNENGLVRCPGCCF